jgi:hypothetical protein
MAALADARLLFGKTARSFPQKEDIRLPCYTAGLSATDLANHSGATADAPVASFLATMLLPLSQRR